MKTRLILPALAGFLAFVSPAAATTVATTPAGYCRLEAGAGRDSWLSAPLVKRAAAVARVSSVATNSLTLGGPVLEPDAYAPSVAGAFYAQFASGPLAGRCYRVLGNTASAVTLATEGEDLTAHPLGEIATGAAGDVVRIRPSWTVAEVFGGESGSLRLAAITGFTGVIYADGDALLLPDNDTTGTEKAPAAVLAYVSGQGWRQRHQPAVDAAATPLAPGVPFVLRRQGTAVAVPFVGYVAPEPGLLRLPALAAGAETDIAVALFHPRLLGLADSGLATVIEPSTDADHARDLLLSPADARGGFSIPPARRLHRQESGWFEGLTAADTQTLRYGAGLVLRLRGERPVRYWRQPAFN